MQRAERDQDPAVPVVDLSTEEGPALRDAVAAARRAERDEAEAAAARERYRSSPLPPVLAANGVATHLLPNEVLHSARPSAILSAPGGDGGLGYGGTLYLTSRRLIHLGQVVLTVALSDILETSMAGERLLLALRAGEGIALDVDRPRLLRAEIAAARRANR